MQYISVNEYFKNKKTGSLSNTKQCLFIKFKYLAGKKFKPHNVYIFDNLAILANYRYKYPKLADVNKRLFINSRKIKYFNNGNNKK